MFPKMSIKGRTCNPTSFVRKDMTKKANFQGKKSGEIIKVKFKIGLWFLSSVLPFINIYVCTKFNCNPFILSKIWPGRATIMKKVAMGR